MLSWAVLPAVSLTDDGEKLDAVPAGKPATAIATVPANPPVELTLAE
jgi:hypothetical protein